MTEANPTTEPTAQKAPERKEPERTFTQADIDAAIAERLKSVNKKHAEELSKFADYEDFKKKAAKLDEIEAANKSELEKATEAAQAAVKRAEEAEAKAARLEAETAHAALVARIASEEEVPANLIHGADEDELRASAQAFKAYVDEHKPKVPETKAGGATPAPDDETKLSERELRAFGM